MTAQGNIFVVSAPSGTGKTTLNRRLVEEHKSVELSISYTARPKREQEIDGEHYHFVAPADFKRLIERGEMLEWAEVFGNMYGTGRSEIKRIQQAGHDVLLEIDVQGWHYARQKLDEATAIFILPPSMAILWERLEKRATEPLEVRFRRLMAAAGELEAAHIYDYFIINDGMDVAYQELVDIIVTKQPRSMGKAEGEARCRALLEEMKTAPWVKEIKAQLAGGSNQESG